MEQMHHLDDDDYSFDEQMDLKMEKQLEEEMDLKHETKMRLDADYAMDRFLPEVINQLEGISRELSKYGYEICVRQLINKLEDY